MQDRSQVVDDLHFSASAWGLRTFRVWNCSCQCSGINTDNSPNDVALQHHYFMWLVNFSWRAATVGTSIHDRLTFDNLYCHPT